MSALPLLLYAFGTATKTKRDRERAASVTTFGQIGGKGPVISIKPGDDVPEGFVARSAMTGTGQSISLPEKAAAQSVFPAYALPDAMPASKAYSDAGLGGARTLNDWAAFFASQNLTQEAQREKLSSLRQIGSFDMSKGGLLTLDSNLLDSYKTKVTPSSEAAGPPIFGSLLNGEFYKDEDYSTMLKKIEELQKNDVDIMLRPGYQTATTFTDGSGRTRNSFVFTQQGQLSEILQAALKVSGENEATLTWTIGGEEKSFTPGDTGFEYDRDMRSFILGKVGDNFDWTTMDAGSLNKVYDFAYNAILRQESANAGLAKDQRGLQLLNPKLMLQVTENAYPNLFQMGKGFKGVEDPDGRVSFARYFYARARKQEQSAIKLAGDSIGAGEDSVNASFTVSTDTTTTVVPMKLTQEEHKSGYLQLLQWSASMGMSEVAARGRVGNAIRMVPSDPTNPASTLVASPVQYALTDLARLSQQPSIGSAPNILANAMYRYDPTRPNFTVNRNELEQVANVVQSVPAAVGINGRPLTEQPMFNDKLSIVSVFSPSLSDPQNNLTDHYRMFDFSNRVFDGKPFIEMQASEANIARSSLEAARLVEQAMSLIFIIGEDGNVSLTPFGQGTSEKLLSLSSFYENAKAGIGVGIRSMGIDENNPLVSAVLTALGQADDIAKNIDDSTNASNIGSAFATQFGSYGRATQSMTNPGQSQDQFRSEEIAARRKTDQELRDIAKDLASGDSILMNAAKRKYLQYVIAYSVASALQGGTGGRTISDQDVQNVLNFIAPGLSTPDKEYDVMRMLRDDLMYKAQRGAALSSRNNQDVFDAMILTDLETMADFDINRNIRNRLRFQTGSSLFSSTSGEDKDKDVADGSIMVGSVEVPKQYQDAFLSALNRQMTANGMPTYESIDDIPANTHQGFAAKFMQNKK